MTIIVSGFPGIGKTFLTDKGVEEFEDIKLKDLDSAEFKKDNDFKENYKKAIEESIGEYDVILVSTHDETQEILKKLNRTCYTIYPSLEAKENWIQRLEERGDSEEAIEFINKNYDNFVKGLEEKADHKIVLEEGMYLTDVIVDLLNGKYIQ